MKSKTMAVWPWASKMAEPLWSSLLSMATTYNNFSLLSDLFDKWKINTQNGIKELNSIVDISCT